MSEEKKTATSRDLPQDVLDVAHRVWLAGLGAMASAQEGGDRLFRQLVDRGREMEGSGRDKVRGAGERARTSADNVRESARSAAEGIGDVLDARVGSVLHRLGVPTRDEIQELTRRVEELNLKIAAAQSAPAARPPAPTPTAKPQPTTGAKPPSSGSAAGAAKPSRTPKGGTGAGSTASPGSGSKAGTGGGRPAKPKPGGAGKTGGGEGDF